MQMAKLADKLGLDPVEIRLKNVLTDEKLLLVGTPIYGGVSMAQVIEETAQVGNWDAANHCGAIRTIGRRCCPGWPQDAALPPASKISALALATRKIAGPR
jgi:hypothetical protein